MADNRMLIIAPSAFLFAASTSVSAQDKPANYGPANFGPANFRAASAEIVTRGPDGSVQVVRVDGTEYQICASDRQDNCMNPRAAGLAWGDRPLRYWPAETASER
jgi:hypothetical protein